MFRVTTDTRRDTDERNQNETTRETFAVCLFLCAYERRVYHRTREQLYDLLVRFRLLFIYDFLCYTWTCTLNNNNVLWREALWNLIIFITEDRVVSFQPMVRLKREKRREPKNFDCKSKYVIMVITVWLTLSLQNPVHRTLSLTFKDAPQLIHTHHKFH